MLFLLKLLLVFIMLKVVWALLFVLFWGAVLFIIISRSLRQKMTSRPNDFRFPR